MATVSGTRFFIYGRWLTFLTDCTDTFDILLTRDLGKAHIIDFNPYAPRTDPLLFTYDELLDLLKAGMSAADATPRPEFRVIDSRSHPTASRNAPTHQHNMVPIEALAMGHGRTLEEFSQVWQEEVRRSAADD